ncbi:MAG: tRNA pseudouridine(38-40) synthase TruA [Tissierellaceae bacterium]|jgi:tRNA pseudouridine38-40 synthase|nr:tRNA pseudouridine(38-40) synthase TruA [Tissierellia bacterium]
MRNIKITIEYDGTNYSGWQRQENALTIQEVLETALEMATGEMVRVIGSGRTDARVHARGQVANFFTTSDIPAERFMHAINLKLPEDILVVKSEEVSLDFHARFDAKGKRYRYVIYNDKLASPLNRNYSYHVKKPLNIDEMRKATKYFIGEKDFRSFMVAKTIVHTAVREIYSMEIRKNDPFIDIVIEGKSFLRNMVRIIAGTLVWVGTGRIKSEEVEKIIEGRDRTLAGPTAPPQGLYLEKVYYD